MTTLWKNVDLNNIVYTETQLKNAKSTVKPRFIKMTWKDGGAVALQLPVTRAPFGISCFNDDSSGVPKYSIALSLDPSYPGITEFTELLKSIDTLNATESEKNSVKWLKENMTKEQIVSGRMYKSIIRPDLKGENPPQLRLKLPVYDGKPGFHVESKNAEETISLMNEEGEFDISWAQPGMDVLVIAECEGLWIIGSDKIYCTWKVAKMRVMRKSNTLSRYQFIEEETDRENTRGGEEEEEEEIADSLDQVDLSEAYMGESE